MKPYYRYDIHDAIHAQTVHRDKLLLLLLCASRRGRAQVTAESAPKQIKLYSSSRRRNGTRAAPVPMVEEKKDEIGKRLPYLIEISYTAVVLSACYVD